MDRVGFDSASASSVSSEDDEPNTDATTDEDGLSLDSVT
jgi:hypothetical protein